MIYKNLIKAYSEQERLEHSKELKLYYFDRGMDSLDKALFYGIDS